jgi:hypothetical protein
MSLKDKMHITKIKINDLNLHGETSQKHLGMRGFVKFVIQGYTQRQIFTRKPIKGENLFFFE